MRKLLFPSLAALLLACPNALAATKTAAVANVAPGDTPSLSANKKKVVYGGAVVLTGEVPVTRAGDKVTLRAEVLQPNGTKQSTAIAETTTDGAGGFTFTTVPTAQTAYTVVWNAAGGPVTSDAITVRVAPRIGLALVRKVGQVVTFSAKATSAIPYLGRHVFVQRRDADGRWVSIKRVLLKSNTVATRTAVRLPQGLSRIMVLMPRSQVGIGYVTGVSRVILVRL
jgi:hypothetical protein